MTEATALANEVEAANQEFKIIVYDKEAKEGAGDKADAKCAKIMAGEVTKIENLIRKA